MKRLSIGITMSIVAALLLPTALQGTIANAASSGEQVYKNSCLSCHGADGNSGFAADLVSTKFKSDYKDLSHLKQSITKTMPMGGEGSLSDSDYQAVSEYLWKLNGNTKVAAAAPKDVTVLLNGKKLSFPVAPVVKNGTTLVPLREIFEALGANVKWDAKTRTVTATKSTTTIKLVIDSKTATKGKQSISLSQAAQIIKGKTFVPLRFVSEALGAQINYNASTKVVTITK